MADAKLPQTATQPVNGRARDFASALDIRRREMTNLTADTKIPRWINTEAGQWAWRADDNWRRTAASALLVQDRRELLNDAERKRVQLREETA